MIFQAMMNQTQKKKKKLVEFKRKVVEKVMKTVVPAVPVPVVPKYRFV